MGSPATSEIEPEVDPEEDALQWAGYPIPGKMTTS
jgi:hypothetical protein